MFGPMVTNGLVCCVDTPGFIALCEDAEERDSNRQADTEKVVEAIDPDATHILAFKMMHNGHEWRTLWLFKCEGEKRSQELWLDVSFTAFKCATRMVALPPHLLTEHGGKK